MKFIFATLRRESVNISPNVLYELEFAKNANLDFIKPIFDLISNHKIIILSSTQEEIKWSLDIPQFGKGERDSMAICKHRNGIFMTNDKKVVRFCEKSSIKCVDLPALLRFAWTHNIKEKEYILKMVHVIEKKDNTIIKNVSAIFED